MKKLLLLLLVLPCLFLTACGTKSNDYKDNSHERFVIIEKTQDDFKDTCGNEITFYIMVDKETKIMYILMSGTYRGGITPLLDKDGNVMIYKGEIK